MSDAVLIFDNLAGYTTGIVIPMYSLAEDDTKLGLTDVDELGFTASRF